MKRFFQLLVTMALIQNTYAADKKTDTKSSGDSDAIPGFACYVDIYFSWQPAPIIPPATDTLQKGKKVAASPVEPPKPIEEFFQNFREIAAVEQSAKDKLTSKIPFLLSEAQKHCESKHQDLASCFGSKTRTFSAEYQLLDFESRREFLDSVREDCKQLAGKCLSNRASDVTCRKEEASQTQSTPGKDEKKK